MRARLYYEQTSAERYETKQNELAEALLESGYSLTVTGSGGGSDMAGSAENDFDVSGSWMDIKSAHKGLEATLDRSVKLTWIWPWSSVLDKLKWKLYYRPLWAWEHRNDPPLPKCSCPPAAFDLEPGVETLHGEHHLEGCDLYCLEDEDFLWPHHDS